nr:chemosensory protein 7 [Pachyrhinus yasumatsui]
MNYYMLPVLFVVVLVAELTLASPEEKYKNNYPNVNIDEILRSDRLLRNYLNCLIEAKDAKCTPDANELKRILPEALETDCVKCEAVQRETAIKVIRFLIDNKRDWWNELAAKYDSDGKYLKKYQEEAKKEHINV